MKDMGISDPKRIYTADDLAPGKNILFAATPNLPMGRCSGRALLWRQVRTSSLVMKLSRSKVRFGIETAASRGPASDVKRSAFPEKIEPAYRIDRPRPSRGRPLSFDSAGHFTDYPSE